MSKKSTRSKSGKCSTRSTAKRKRPSFKRGDKAWIYHLGSPPGAEAVATIVAPVTGIPDLYRVRFPGEVETCLRFVFPEWQHPRALDQLRALWRVTVHPEFLLPEFPWRDRAPGSTRAGKAKRRAITRSKAEGE